MNLSRFFSAKCIIFDGWHKFFKPHVHNGTRKIGYPTHENMKERRVCSQ